MADDLQLVFAPKFTLTYKRDLSGAPLIDRIKAGAAAFASLDLAFNYGTGVPVNNIAKANKSVRNLSKSFAAGDTDIDLTAVVNDDGRSINFGKIKFILLRLTAPATGVYLKLGNYGANGFLGWLSANNIYQDVRSQFWQSSEIDGWTVDGTHRYLRVNNPGGTAVVADLILAGE